jgi:hypothetical protein
MRSVQEIYDLGSFLKKDNKELMDCPITCLEGVWRTAKNLSDSWHHDQDFKLGSPEYEAGMLTERL